MRTRFFTLAFAATMVSAASAQNVVAVSGPGRPEIALASHAAKVTFVADEAAAAPEALKDKAISAVEGKTLGALATRTVPIPFVGALPVEGALRIVGDLPVGGAVKAVGAKTVEGARKLIGRLRKQR